MEDQAGILTRLLPLHWQAVHVCALIPFFTAACLLPAPASGADSSSAEVSSEATNCFAFYAMQRRCSPLDATPDSLDLVKSWAERASDIAIRYGKAAGMTEEELGERHVAAVVSVASEMGKSCVGLSIVRSKYLASCKSLLEDPEERANELRAKERHSGRSG